MIIKKETPIYLVMHRFFYDDVIIRSYICNYIPILDPHCERVLVIESKSIPNPHHAEEYCISFLMM